MQNSKFKILNLKFLIFLSFNLLIFQSFSQNSDSLIIKKIFDDALKSKESYANLEYLCKRIGGRLTGSPQAAAAVEFTKQVMNNMNLDLVYLQEMTVPVWVRGEKEIATMTSTIFGSKQLNVTALGKSVGTGTEGIYSKVIEVKSFKELDSLAYLEARSSKLETGKSRLQPLTSNFQLQSSKSQVSNSNRNLKPETLNIIKGKIVFFNKAPDPTLYNTFNGYGSSVWQRVSGAAHAAKYGAIAVIVRSSEQGDPNNPHTGGNSYEKDVPQIPAIGISASHADLLSQWLKKDPDLIVYIRTTCHYLKDTKSYNVIGVIKGSVYPDEIITVGGHLDSWDTGEGAQDDGTGAMQSIEVLRLIKSLNIKPRHTIRAVMFMDEEIFETGADTYLANAIKNHEKLIAAIESDRGGMTPTGFSVVGSNEVFNKTKNFINLMNLTNLTNLQALREGSGVDVGPLEKLNIPCFGLVTDSQRYFEYHHSYNDRFENVSPREMQLGAASIASFIYLIDKYGF